MSKMTYNEFGELVTKMGYQAWLNFEAYAQVADESGATVAVVHKKQYKVLSLDWITFKRLTDEERDLLADAYWKLASTPLKDREEPKKYYLKVCPKYSPFFDSPYEYLNINRDNEMVVSTKHETSLYKTIFTEEEINELAKEYDLSLFEKVEVIDE